MSRPWNKLSEIVQLRSPWLTLIGERLQDDGDRILDYWRVEKADSVVILTLHQGRFCLPKPCYRPGLGEMTLDFPGGRVSAEASPEAAALAVLQRELGVTSSQVTQLQPLSDRPWAINSSFSNQKLWGFVAEIADDAPLDASLLTDTDYPCNEAGIAALLTDLTCLQCRAVLLEWWRGRSLT
jgi:hypothetical protein